MSDKRIRKIDQLLGDISAAYAPSNVAKGVYEVRLALYKLERLIETTLTTKKEGRPEHWAERKYDASWGDWDDTH
jgi:hypothetical protein